MARPLRQYADVAATAWLEGLCGLKACSSPSYARLSRSKCRMTRSLRRHANEAAPAWPAAPVRLDGLSGPKAC